MNDKIFNSSDLGDPAGDHIGLFDRIINIKFIPLYKMEKLPGKP